MTPNQIKKKVLAYKDWEWWAERPFGAFIHSLFRDGQKREWMTGIVRSESDIKKVKKGDILLTPMTIPNFMPALEKASAFVTDEGGITCHAAIIAREMKKPCVIGTKIATKIFKDGDLVEVDANKGTVRKI